MISKICLGADLYENDVYLKIKKKRKLTYLLLVFTFILVGCKGKDTSKEQPAVMPTLLEPTVISQSKTQDLSSNVLVSDNTTIAPQESKDEDTACDLCGENEEILLSFKMADTDKYASICLSKYQQEYIIYRFGMKDNIELEFGDKTKSSWDSFIYSYYMRGGGPDNEGLDLNYLYFESGGYKYQIYEEYSADNDDTSVGILVTDLESGAETYLKGDSDSIKGSLVGLRDSEKIIINIQ